MIAPHEREVFDRLDAIERNLARLDRLLREFAAAEGVDLVDGRDDDRRKDGGGG
jgi:hypothetical protein